MTLSRSRRESGDKRGSTLSSVQVLRRTVAEVLGVSMNATQLARGAIDELAVERYQENERLATGGPSTGDTMEGLYQELKELIPVQLHALCAHVLTRSKAVVKTGSTAEVEISNLAEEFRQRKELDRRPRTMEEAMACVNEIAREQHGVVGAGSGGRF